MYDNIRLGMSVGKYQPEDIDGFIAAGFSCFEVGVPGKMPDPNPLARSPEEKKIHPYTFEEACALSCTGEEEKLVDLRRPVAEKILNSSAKLNSVHLPFGAGWDIAGFDETVRQTAVDKIKKVIDLTLYWKPEIYVLHGCLEPVESCQREARLLQCKKSVSELMKYASLHGTELAMENLPRSCLANTSAETKDIVDATGVSICFDVNHLLLDSHENFLDMLEKNIITTHLSDYDGIDERHWIPGEGTVPWKLIVDRLINAGYKGAFLFELREDESTPGQIREAFMNCLK